MSGAANGRSGLRLDNAELWSGIVGLALGGFVVWSGVKSGIGTINDPGSGFVLFYTGILMCIFAGSSTLSAITDGGPTVASLWAGARWGKTILVIVCLIAFALVFNTLGFLPSSMLLMLLLLRVVDPVRWTLAIPIAVLVPLGAWYVLTRALLIQLPSGILLNGYEAIVWWFESSLHSQPRVRQENFRTETTLEL